MTVDEPGTWLEASAVEGTLRLRVYARNFESTGCDRGGSVPIAAAAPRTSPCLSPFHHVYIDYNGSVMPCCNLRSDVDAHRETIIANLHQQPDLFAIYAGETMAAWRRGLIGFDPKSGLCASCSFVTYPETPEHLAVHARLRESLLLGARAS
jgi:Iron-sulfur cluster-binding domain